MNSLPMPPSMGLLGHVKALKKTNVHQQMLQWIKEYGASFNLRLGAKKVLVISDAKDVKQALKSRPDVFRRLKNIESVFEEAGVNGVFSAEGERWKKNRLLTDPAFQPRHLRSFLPALKKHSIRLENRFSLLAKNQEKVDLLQEFKRFTLDVTIELAFGTDVNSIEKGESDLEKAIRVIFPMINKRITSPIPLWRFVPTAKDKEFDASLAYVRKEVSSFIEVQKARMADNPALFEEPENILQAMLAAKESEAHLSDDDIFANAITLLLAGEDTTANTLAWMSFLLTEKPQWQQTLCDEMGAELETLEWPLPKAPALTAVMYETMRLKPVAPQLYLEAIVDTKIGDHHIAKGTPIFVMLHANGHNEELFKAPEEFSPERWLDEGGASFSNLQPFGGGVRLCPGRALAMLEIKLAMTALLKQFEVEPLQPSSEVIEEFAFTLSPKGFYCQLKAKS